MKCLVTHQCERVDGHSEELLFNFPQPMIKLDCPPHKLLEERDHVIYNMEVPFQQLIGTPVHVTLRFIRLKKSMLEVFKFLGGLKNILRYLKSRIMSFFFPDSKHKQQSKQPRQVAVLKQSLTFYQFLRNLCRYNKTSTYIFFKHLQQIKVTKIAFL